MRRAGDRCAGEVLGRLASVVREGVRGACQESADNCDAANSCRHTPRTSQLRLTSSASPDAHGLHKWAALFVFEFASPNSDGLSLAHKHDAETRGGWDSAAPP